MLLKPTTALREVPAMATMSHDVTDLFIAPVVLHIEAELESFEDLDGDQIRKRLAIETNREPRSTQARRDTMMQALTRFVDLHGWNASWTPRGLSLRHDHHAVTLGLPPAVIDYLEAG